MRRRSGLFVVGALLLLSWGVFAFGGVYTWAHAPLLTFSLSVSALGFLAGRGSSDSALRPYRPLALCLSALLGAALLQCVPLPPEVVTAVSPARDDADYPKLFAQRTLRQYDPQAPQQPPRTLSVEPSRTALGLAFIAGFGLLLLGAANGFSAFRPTMFVRGVIVVGVLTALADLVQLSLSGEARSFVYGFFPPINSFAPAAPFLNRNHTAGVLVMTAAVTLGYLASSVLAGWQRVKPEWRERLLWFGTRDGSESLLVAFAFMVIGTGVIATQSRSGVLTLGMTLLLFAYVVVRRQGSRAGKAIVLVATVLAGVLAMNQGGIEGVLKRFGALERQDPFDRTVIWQSARRQARAFPLTGTGLNTFGVASLHYQPADERRREVDVEAHNDYLQLGSEGGLLLGVPAIASIASLVVLIRRRFREGRDDWRIYWLRVGAVIGLVAVASQSAVEFTLQMPGAATLAVFLAAIAIHRPTMSRTV